MFKYSRMSFLRVGALTASMLAISSGSNESNGSVSEDIQKLYIYEPRKDIWDMVADTLILPQRLLEVDSNISKFDTTLYWFNSLAQIKDWITRQDVYSNLIFMQNELREPINKIKYLFDTNEQIKVSDSKRYAYNISFFGDLYSQTVNKTNTLNAEINRYLDEILTKDPWATVGNGTLKYDKLLTKVFWVSDFVDNAIFDNHKFEE